MKHLKQKLMAAAAMVMVATVMLSSASYAWFTISTAPEVTGIATKVEANENLEIALDKGNMAIPAETALPGTGTYTTDYTTWGNNVVFTSTDFTGLSIGPADLGTGTNANLLVTATYDDTGRPSGTEAVTLATHAAGTKAYAAKDSENNIVATYMDFWLRTNVSGNITLQVGAVNGTDVVDKDSTEATKPTIVRVAAQVFPASTTVVSTEASAIYELIPGATDATTIITSMAADTPQRVRIYLYLDGELVHNSNMAADIASVGVSNLTFRNTEIDGTESYKLTVTQSTP